MTAGPELASPPLPARRPRRRATLALVLLLTLAVGGTIWWRDRGKRLFFPRNFAEVESGLFRSGQIHRRLIEKILREQRIDLVIDLARDRADDEDERVEREVTQGLGIPLLSMNRLGGDGMGNPNDYVEALAALREARLAGKRVLVHCRGGSERTGVLFQLYRTLYEGWSPADAFAEYASFRNKPPSQAKTPGYIDAHLQEVVAGLVARGALDAAPDPLPVFTPAVAAAR